MTGSNPRDGRHAESSVASYLCPYCAAAGYPTETLVRVHVSYADDDSHEGLDGMTPEIEPIELDAAGEQTGRAFTLAGDLNLHELELEDIPATYDGRTLDERERRALLVAAFNANRDTPATELQDRVTTHLEQRGLEPLPVRELDRLCRWFFLPHVDDDGVSDTGEATETPDGDSTAAITTAETTLRNLTPLQQAIILAHVARPDVDWTDIADQVGTARSYPAQVIDARTDLVERLRGRLENHGSLERLIAARVPDEDIEAILDEGHLAAVDIDLRAALADGHAARSDPVPEDRGTAGDVRPDSAGVPARGSESSSTPDGEDSAESSVRRANERTTEDREHTTAEERVAGDESPDGPITDDSVTPTAEDGASVRPLADGRENGAAIPRGEVEQVRKQIRFDLEVIEQEMEMADPTPQQVRTKAYLEQILERLDEILS